MNKKYLFSSLFIFILIFTFGCSDNAQKTADSAPDTVLSYGVTSGILAAIDDTNDQDNLNNESNAVLNEEKVIEPEPQTETHSRTVFPENAWKQAVAATELFAEVTFNNFVFGNSDYTLSGSVLRHWNNLIADAENADKITNGTVFQQAILSKIFTDANTETVITVTGDGALICDISFSGTFSDYPVARSFTYNSFSSASSEYLLSISLTREKIHESQEVFRHKITTSSGSSLDIAVDRDASTRTIKSGELSVNCMLVDKTIAITFDNVVVLFGKLIPDSGTAAYIITDNSDSSVTETGTITFNGTTNPEVVITGSGSSPSVSKIQLDL